MTGRPGGMVHEGVPFADPRGLAAELAGPVSAALAAGEPVIAVLDEDNRAALTAAIGSATDAVEFLDPVAVHRLPAFTVATRWARLSRRAARPEQRTTVVAQHMALPGIDAAHWIRLDAALNVALEGLPITMLCPCRADADLDLVRATHPVLRVDGRSEPSGDLRDPAQLVAQYPPPPPPDLGVPLVDRTFDTAALPALRHLVAETSTAAGLDPEHVADLVLAVNEIATNSVEHGPGLGRLRMWSTADGFVAEVYDVGRMGVPFPGMVAPSPSGERGRGLWLASELADVLQVWSDDTGTIVRLTVEAG
ncbi:sensor histidine kinase [Pseudonocardia ailaonensis]|uniref:Sensor histidine kinase n=1 Tax=Pseudonocardia ailaonensis TaxID=367279 RepID=A0ABN2MUP4_9PSEU